MSNMRGREVSKGIGWYKAELKRLREDNIEQNDLIGKQAIEVGRLRHDIRGLAFELSKEQTAHRASKAQLEDEADGIIREIQDVNHARHLEVELERLREKIAAYERLKQQDEANVERLIRQKREVETAYNELSATLDGKNEDLERLQEEKAFWLEKTDQLAAEVRERYKPAEARLHRIEEASREALRHLPHGPMEDLRTALAEEA